jgi:hypothetical protein
LHSRPLRDSMLQRAVKQMVDAVEANFDHRNSAMKLRIRGNSLRFRLSQTEVAQLLNEGRIEDTLIFGPEPYSRLSYALEHSTACASVLVRPGPQSIAVVAPSTEVTHWAQNDAVGIYAEFETGDVRLDVMIEKDFACLDASEADNRDTFPNPSSDIKCK